MFMASYTAGNIMGDYFEDTIGSKVAYDSKAQAYLANIGKEVELNQKQIELLTGEKSTLPDNIKDSIKRQKKFTRDLRGKVKAHYKKNPGKWGVMPDLEKRRGHNPMNVGGREAESLRIREHRKAREKKAPAPAKVVAPAPAKVVAPAPAKVVAPAPAKIPKGKLLGALALSSIPLAYIAGSYSSDKEEKPMPLPLPKPIESTITPPEQTSSMPTWQQAAMLTAAAGAGYGLSKFAEYLDFNKQAFDMRLEDTISIKTGAQNPPILPVRQLPSKGRLALGGLTLAGAFGVHKLMLEEAAKENDPIETAMNSLEENVLDPVDTGFSGKQKAGLLAALAVPAALYGAHKYYNR